MTDRPTWQESVFKEQLDVASENSLLPVVTQCRNGRQRRADQEQSNSVATIDVAALN